MTRKRPFTPPIPASHVSTILWDNDKGKAIRTAREKKGWYRKHLGKFVGCSFQFIQNIEEGTVKTVTMTMLEDLCRVLEISILTDVLGVPVTDPQKRIGKRRKRKNIQPPIPDTSKVSPVADDWSSDISSFLYSNEEDIEDDDII